MNRLLRFRYYVNTAHNRVVVPRFVVQMTFSSGPHSHAVCVAYYNVGKMLKKKKKNTQVTLITLRRYCIIICTQKRFEIFQLFIQE